MRVKLTAPRSRNVFLPYKETRTLYVPRYPPTISFAWCEAACVIREGLFALVPTTGDACPLAAPLARAPRARRIFASSIRRGCLTSATSPFLRHEKKRTNFLPDFRSALLTLTAINGID